MDRQVRLNKIQQVLEGSLGLSWVDRLIYNHNSKIYRTATIFDFNPGRATYVHLQDEKHKRYLARVVIDKDSFVININGMKINATDYWKEITTEQTVEPKPETERGQMMKNYKMCDIYDYLQQFYNLEWRKYQIKDGKIERSITQSDFSETQKSSFYVIAIMYQGANQKTVSLSVNNESLEVYEINPYLHHYDKPMVGWVEYLQSRYSNENTL